MERASPTDQAFWAMDIGGVPEQFGVLLQLDAPLDLERVRRVLAGRVAAVPRLRQRLVAVPLGCGGPIWVDDPGFRVADHVHQVAGEDPADEEALLATALTVVSTPIPRTAPLWSVTLVTGPAGGPAALVVVLHHVLADGVGGLRVLGALVDGAPPPIAPPFPRPWPGRGRLASDALAGRVAAVRGAPASWRLLRRSLAAGGGLRPPRAAPCSLVRRVGPHRRVAAVRVDLGALRDVAHGHGATANDAVLVAVAGALRRLLATRGERLDAFTITVPVSGRRGAEAASEDLGNMVSPLLVSVPAVGAVEGRLRRVAAAVRAGRASATGPPPIALLGWLFRPLAELGGYRWYMDHQRRFHTLVSHVRGPATPVAFAGARVLSVTPIAVAEGGNAAAYFEVLSYAGTLSIAVVVDPDMVPELDVLIGGLRAELDAVLSGGATHGA